MNKIMRFQVILFVLLIMTFIFVAICKKNKRIKLIFSVQSYLYDVHTGRNNFDKALELVRKCFSAREVLFFSLYNDSLMLQPNDINGGISSQFLSKKKIIYELKEISLLCPKSVILVQNNINEKYVALKRFMHENATERVVASFNRVSSSKVDALVVVQPTRLDGLKSVMNTLIFSFSKTARNIRYVETIKMIGETDSLTGDMNRLAYKRYIEELKMSNARRFGCVYIDVNGLHNMNNIYGHTKGDEMLCAISNELKKEFGKDCVFRIGGDEFVIIDCIKNESLLQSGIERVKARIAEKEYYISAGVEVRDCCDDIMGAIDAAEKKMFEEKNNYYKMHNEVELRV